jgi:hypothetical protein
MSPHLRKRGVATVVGRFRAVLMVMLFAGVLSSSAPPARSVPGGCPPCLTDVAVDVRGRFVESRFDGSLVVSGRLEERASEIRVRLLTIRHEHWRRSLAYELPPGAFEHAVKVPRDTRPGRYTVEVRAENQSWTYEPPVGGCLRAGGTGVGFECYSRPLTLPLPAEGYVDSAYASQSPAGRPVQHVPARNKQVWVRFEFWPGALPRTESELSVTWRLPSGRQIAGPIRRPRSFAVTSYFRSTRPLAKGSWLVILRAGSTAVKRLRFDVR